MMNKNKIFKFLQAMMILFFGVLFVFLIVRTGIKQQDVICTKIVPNIKNEGSVKFISTQDVKNIVAASEHEVVNKKVSEIDMVKLEESLEKNEYIDNAEVYLNFEGVLKIDVVQKKPLYRIINNNNVSYYISEKAYRVPLSTNFTARLIVATGYIPNVEDVNFEKTNRELKQLVDFIHADPFWKAMIGQIEVNKAKEFVLIPKLKGHTVLLGGVENLDSKLEKLKIFYKEALNKTNWTKYKEINLKYKGQLVCSK